jgi:hypothetical protein
MQSQRQLEVPKGVLMTATDVLWVHSDSLTFKPTGDFKIADHGRSGALGDGHRITHVIAMPMRDQNEIRFHLIGIGGRGGVVGKERVHQNLMLADIQLEGSVTQPCQSK